MKFVITDDSFASQNITLFHRAHKKSHACDALVCLALSQDLLFFLHFIQKYFFCDKKLTS
jgi:hypothetical protein